MVTISDVKSRLFGIDISKVSDEHIQITIDEAVANLTYLRKSSVPDNIFDIAVATNAAWKVVFRFIESNNYSVLGYNTAGRNEYLKSMKADADEWKAKVVKRIKAVTT